jgi:hypothetical protein
MKLLKRVGFIALTVASIIMYISEAKGNNNLPRKDKVQIQSCCCSGAGTVGYGSTCDYGEGFCLPNPCPSCANLL